MGRYFNDEDAEGKKDGGRDVVYKITKDDLRKISKKDKFKAPKYKGQKYDKKGKFKKRKGPDQFPGRKPVSSESLEKHSRGEGVRGNIIYLSLKL